MRETFSCNNRPKYKETKNTTTTIIIIINYSHQITNPPPTKVSQWFFSFLCLCLSAYLTLALSGFCSSFSHSLCWCLCFVRHNLIVSPLLSIISFSSPMIDRVCCKFSFLSVTLCESLSPFDSTKLHSASQNKTIRSLPDIFYLFVCVNLSYKTRERDCHGCHRLLSSLVMSLSWLKCLDQTSLLMLILFFLYLFTMWIEWTTTTGLTRDNHEISPPFYPCYIFFLLFLSCHVRCVMIPLTPLLTSRLSHSSSLSCNHHQSHTRKGESRKKRTFRC